MAVVINDFEATVESGGEGSAVENGGRPAKLRPHEVRRQLRRVAARALRIRPC